MLDDAAHYEFPRPIGRTALRSPLAPGTLDTASSSCSFSVIGAAFLLVVLLRSPLASRRYSHLVASSCRSAELSVCGVGFLGKAPLSFHILDGEATGAYRRCSAKFPAGRSSGSSRKTTLQRLGLLLHRLVLLARAPTDYCPPLEPGGNLDLQVSGMLD